MKKKIFILLGHPNKETLLGFFADSYQRGAKEAGHEVVRVNIGDLAFDPILHMGYKAIQELEPDLRKVQEHIRWCDHFVLLYPTWWSTMPALLKGLFDRMWLPGFAFRFSKSGYWWTKLLKGKTATVIVTANTPNIFARIVFGDTTNEIRRGILKFAGFNPVKLVKIGQAEKLSDGKKQYWVKKMVSLGKRAK